MPSYATMAEIKENFYLSKLVELAEKKNAYGRFVECEKYTTENTFGGIWFAYGTNKQKVTDTKLCFHIKEAYERQQTDVDFYLDFNIIQITEHPPFSVHQEVCKQLSMIDFLQKIFEDRAKPIPDKMSRLDAQTIASLFTEMYTECLSDARHFKTNLDLIYNIVRTSDITHNPLHPKYEGYMEEYPNYRHWDMGKMEFWFIRKFKKHKNRVKPLALLRTTGEIKSFACPNEFAKDLIKELYKHPDILFYVSPKSTRREFYGCTNYKKDLAKVRYFMFAKKHLADVREILYRCQYPMATSLTKESLMRLGEVDIVSVYKNDFEFIEKEMYEKQIPFCIDTRNTSADENTMCLFFSKSRTADLVKILNRCAWQAENASISIPNLPTDATYKYLLDQQKLNERLIDMDLCAGNHTAYRKGLEEKERKRREKNKKRTQDFWGEVGKF